MFKLNDFFIYRYLAAWKEIGNWILSSTCTYQSYPTLPQGIHYELQMDNSQPKPCNIPPMLALSAILFGLNRFPAWSYSPSHLRVTPDLHTTFPPPPDIPVMSFSTRRGSTLSLISYNSQCVERKMTTTQFIRVCLIIANKITVALYSHFEVAGTKQRWPRRPAFSTRKSIIIPWEITRWDRSTYCVLSLSCRSHLPRFHLPDPRRSCIGWLAMG